MKVKWIAQGITREYFLSQMIMINVFQMIRALSVKSVAIALVHVINLFDFLPADATVRQMTNMLENTLEQAHDLMVTEEQQEIDIITGQNCRHRAGNSIYPDKLMQYKHKDEYFSKATEEAKAKQNVIYKIILDLEQGGARFLTNTDEGLNMMTPDEIFVKVRKNLLDLKRDRASAMKKTETN